MPNVQLLFGPMLIGTFMNAILYGVLVVQIFIYFQTYKKDATWIRYFVFFLLIMETLNTGLDIVMIYQPLVQKFGTSDATTFFPHLLAADPIVTVIISTPIQIFIAWRLKIISRALWLAIAIGVLAFISFGGGIWLTVTVIRLRRFARKPDLHWPALTWLLASALVDVTIAVSLSVHLARRRTGFSSTDDAINRIIRLTVQTGLITAIFATLDVVCFLALPHTTINFVWDFALSKLYTNSFVSTLNARAGWGNLINGQSGSDSVFSSESRMPRFHTYSMSHFRNPQIVSGDRGRHSAKTQPDVEYGVTITKEINTRRDFPDVPYHTQ